MELSSLCLLLEKENIAAFIAEEEHRLQDRRTGGGGDRRGETSEVPRPKSSPPQLNPGVVNPDLGECCAAAQTAEPTTTTTTTTTTKRTTLPEDFWNLKISHDLFLKELTQRSRSGRETFAKTETSYGI
ncbi:uncharacterized protein LOC106945663 isoform X2 [Poecilia latipinna]|uniref:uncharacterized protein LOC106945663 isoform X2 n=1 Tax=Poecilia latipinna TaxID=48699 RepID=UPI00072E226C|nr:PREDICTED: uncharacterized protein LOC106945663 isoform X2 [Poecilia latipinna]